MTTTVSKPQTCPQPSEAKTESYTYICEECGFQTEDHSRIEFHISLAHSEPDVNGSQVSQPLSKRQKTSESDNQITGERALNETIIDVNTTVEPIASEVNRCEQTSNIQNLVHDIDKTSVSRNVLTKQSDKKVTKKSTLNPKKTKKSVVNEVSPGIVVPTHNVLLIPNTILTNTGPIVQPIEDISHNANQLFGSELYLNRHSNIPQNDSTVTTSISTNPQTIYTIVKSEDDSSAEPVLTCNQPNIKLMIPIPRLKASSVEPMVKSFACKKCPFITDIEREIRSHRMTHTKARRLEALKDDDNNKGILNAFSPELDMKCHMTEDGLYKCPNGKCEETSTNLETLRLHYNREHEQPSKSCDWPGCDYTAKRRHQLKKHMLSHTNERNFACDWPECGKTFKTSKDLLNHVKRTHSQEKPHACHWPDCDYRSYTSSQLKEHLISHSNEYNYLCVWPECGKKFKTKRYLEIHMRIHNNDKRYVCQYTDCQYRTCFAANIKTHMKVHRK